MPSLLFPPVSLSLSPVFVCFSVSSCSFCMLYLISSTARGTGFRSAAACTAAGLGSAVESPLFSCTVSRSCFPLGPRDGIFVEGCNEDCCSPLLDSCAACFEAAGGGGVCVLLVGVAFCMLMLGGTLGAGVEAAAASSGLLPAIEAMPGCREFDREDGGGLFNRGEAGHCGVVSPDTDPALFWPPRAGSFDTASVTAPPAESDGTLLADSARWMAAAEGCVEKDWLARGPGRLSLRTGEVLREDLGLAAADGEEELGRRDVELCFRNCGAGWEEVEEEVFWREALGLRRWTVAVDEAEEDSGPSEGVGVTGGGDGCLSAGWSGARPFMLGRESAAAGGIVWCAGG